MNNTGAGIAIGIAFGAGIGTVLTYASEKGRNTINLSILR